MSQRLRFNLLGAIEAYRDAPNVIGARERIKRFGAAAVANLVNLRKTEPWLVSTAELGVHS